MTFNSAMQKMQFEGLVEFITEHNGLVAKVNAATGDRDALAESIRESDEFADVRNKIAELEEQLTLAVNEKVEAALSNATGDTEGLTEKVKDLKSTIASGISYYKKLYGDEAAEAFPKVDRIKGQRAGGGGGGGKRIRGYNWTITMDDGEVTEYENAASAAKALGCDTTDLQEQFFAKAGVEKIKDAPDEVSFSVEFEDEDGDGNKTPRTATIKAYRTGPSGPPEKADEATEEAPVEEAPESPDEDDLVDF